MTGSTFPTPWRILPLAIGLVGTLAAVSLMTEARGVTVAGNNVRVTFQGRIIPRSLPRAERAPVALHVAGRVRPVKGRRPTGLARLSVEVNRHARFTMRGLPSCAVRKLRGTSSRAAMASCGEALLGRGRFRSHIDIPEQAPFPAVGRALAFNTSRPGRRSIAIHVFGRQPASTSTVLAATLRRSRGAAGVFGPQLTVEMPRIGDDWGYVTAFNLTVRRRYRHRGRLMSVVSASCPAPADLREVPFKAARASFELVDGRVLTRTVGGTCRAIG